MVAQPDDVGPDPASARRVRERYAAQRYQWGSSALKPVRKCARTTLPDVDFVQLRASVNVDGQRMAGFAGLMHCGSPWACPVCASRIAAARQRDIETAITTWQAKGGRVGFLTYTVRHNRSQSIDDVWDGVQAGQHAITSGRAWQALKARFGVETGRETITTCPAKSCGQDTPRGRRHNFGHTNAEGVKVPGACKVGTDKVTYTLPWVRVVEVTCGCNGWHVHQHVLVFLPAGSTDKDLAEYYDLTWSAWNDGARAAGLDGSLRVNEAKWVTTPEEMAEYFSKQQYRTIRGAAMEATRSDLKRGRAKGRTPFEILAGLVGDLGDRSVDDLEADARLWTAFELASKGRRQMTWAVGARDMLGLTEPEQTDEEAASEEVGTSEDTKAAVPKAAWRMVVDIPGRRSELREALLTDDWSCRVLLDRWGVPWVERPPAREPGDNRGCQIGA